MTDREYVPPQFDALEAEQAAASFTSRKLDVLDAMAMDPRLSPAEFRVAYLIVQHANAKTGAMFPSQERLAIQMGVRTRWVRHCIDGVVEKGWLTKHRPNRQRPNSYTINTQHMNAILDRITSLLDAMNEAKGFRSERHDNVTQKNLTGTIMPLQTGTIGPLQSGTIGPLNTLTEHRKGTPEEERAQDGEPRDSQYAAIRARAGK